jgi:hypothetical protein
VGILTVDNGLGGVRSRGVAVCARMGISGSNINAGIECAGAEVL